MPKKQKAKIKQKNKCPEKLIRTEAAKEIAEIDRSLQDQKYQLRCRAAIDLLKAEYDKCRSFAQETPCCDQPDQQQSEDGREYLYKTDPERPGAGF